MEKEIAKNKSKRSIFRKLLTPLSIVGLIIILIMITLAVFAPWLSPYSYLDVAINIFAGDFEAPSSAHLFGTTEFGRDVLGRLIWGSRASLTSGLIAISLGLIIGVIIGLIAAYFGGFIDNLIMRIIDIIMSFPGLILAMVIIGILGKTMENILIAFSILLIPEFARLTRGSVLQEKNKTYIEAAKVSGARDFKIMFKYLLPNSISPIVIAATFDLGSTILGIASLNFIGLGEPNIVEWGRDINVGAAMLQVAPWAVLWPGFFISITVLGFMLIGDGLRDALDPRYIS